MDRKWGLERSFAQVTATTAKWLSASVWLEFDFPSQFFFLFVRLQLRQPAGHGRQLGTLLREIFDEFELGE